MKQNMIESDNQWRRSHVLWIVALSAAAIALTWRGWYDLGWLAFNDEESSHLMLVPMVVAYLLWQRWDAVLKCKPKPGWIGPIVLALGIFAWEYGYRYDYRVGDHLGAVLVLAGCVACVTGDRFVLRFWSIFLLLAFLIPLPYTVRIAIAVPLQRANALVAYEILSVAGVEILRYGSVLEVNGQQVGVAEACNGMRSILAVLLVCYAMAFATKIRASARLLLLAATPLIALSANLVRLVLTVLAYGYGSSDFADTLHDMLGWGTIGLAFGFVWAVIALARWLMIPINAPEQPKAVRPKKANTPKIQPSSS
jgi:exosortase